MGVKSGKGCTNSNPGMMFCDDIEIAQVKEFVDNNVDNG